MNHKEIAERYFKNYPLENKLLIVDDGTVFLMGNKLDCNAYAASKRLNVTAIHRKDLVEKPQADNLSNVPDSSWSKKDLIIWLTEKGASFKANESKESLLENVQSVLLAEDGDLTPDAEDDITDPKADLIPAAEDEITDPKADLIPAAEDEITDPKVDLIPAAEENKTTPKKVEPKAKTATSKKTKPKVK